jgi:hypothetical protein
MPIMNENVAVAAGNRSKPDSEPGDETIREC